MKRKQFVQFLHPTTEREREMWLAPDALFVVVTPLGCFKLRDKADEDRARLTGKISIEAVATMECVAGDLDAVAIAEAQGVHFTS